MRKVLFPHWSFASRAHAYFSYFKLKHKHHYFIKIKSYMDITGLNATDPPMILMSFPFCTA